MRSAPGDSSDRQFRLRYAHNSMVTGFAFYSARATEAAVPKCYTTPNGGEALQGTFRLNTPESIAFRAWGYLS
jgi:hypothetical protein